MKPELEQPYPDLELTVIDQPYLPDIDGGVLLKRGDQEIVMAQWEAEQLAIDLMRAYGLQWWPEPEDDVP